MPRVSSVTAILHFNLGRRFEKTKLEWWRALSHHLLLDPLVISSNRLITVLAILDRRIQKEEISMQLISIPNDIHTYTHISQKFRNVLQRKKKKKILGPIFTTVDFLIYILNYAIFGV